MTPYQLLVLRGFFPLLMTVDLCKNAWFTTSPLLRQQRLGIESALVIRPKVQFTQIAEAWSSSHWVNHSLLVASHRSISASLIIYEKFAVVDANKQTEKQHKKTLKFALKALFIIYFARENPPQHEKTKKFVTKLNHQIYASLVMRFCLPPFSLYELCIWCRWRSPIEFNAENENRIRHGGRWWTAIR